MGRVMAKGVPHRAWKRLSLYFAAGQEGWNGKAGGREQPDAYKAASSDGHD